MTAYDYLETDLTILLCILYTHGVRCPTRQILPADARRLVQDQTGRTQTFI